MYVLLRRLTKLRSQIALRGGPRQSLALRHVDAGSCNGCEHELGAASNPYYDLQRFGLNIVASPRHADVLLVTGAVTRNMREAMLRAYESMPEPRLVAAVGDCALGLGLLGVGVECGGGVEPILPVDIRIPGCPPAPDAIAAALNRFLDSRGRSLSVKARGPSQENNDESKPDVISRPNLEPGHR